MVGPNCPEYVFYTDGTVEHFRVDVDERTLEGRATLDVRLVQRVIDELQATDLAELRATLPDGEDRSIYDGTNMAYRYEVLTGNGAFSSVTVELLDSVPLFAATGAALEAARDALGPLDMLDR